MRLMKIKKEARFETIGSWDQKEPKIIIGDRASCYCSLDVSLVVINDGGE